MARKKAKQKNDRKKGGTSRTPAAENGGQADIAAWLDTFCGLAGERGSDDEGISHLVVPEDYRESVGRILSLIEKRERERSDPSGGGAGLTTAQLIRRLEEAGVAGLTEAAMVSATIGTEVQFALLDELSSSALDQGASQSTEGLREVGHMLQDLVELLPGEPPAFHAQRFLDLAPGHRALLLRLLQEKTGERVIPFLELVSGRDTAVDLQVVEIAGAVASEAAAALLLRLESETAEKQVLKAVSKMLYSLRSRGVKGAERDAAQAPAPVGSPIRYEEPQETRAFVSGIDWQGQRLVLLAGLPGARGYAVAQALLDDDRGVREFTVWKMSRADLREMIDRAQERTALLLCEVPPEHAYYLLEEAFQDARPRGFDPAREFLSWRSAETWPKPECAGYRHPVRELITGGDAGTVSGADWSRLLATDPLVGWTLGPEEAVKAWREVQEAGESTIILPGAMQEERSREALQGVIAARFGAEDRRRLCRRLEETAYVLRLTDKPDEARLALVACDLVQQLKDRIWEHPLIAGMVQRDIDLVARREAEAKEKDVSLVRSPWDEGRGRS